MIYKRGFTYAFTVMAVFHLVFLVPFARAMSNESQWRGKNRDGVYDESGLLKSWPENGPALIWSQEGIGAGWSSVVSDGETLFVTGTKDTTDYLSAMTKDGKLLWQIPFARAWHESFPEARCTPTVADGKVYLISAHGKVMRVDVASSKIDWQRDAYTQFGGKYGVWGTSESPLLVGNKMIYTPAGSKTTVVALNKDTGETLWQSESLDDTSAYASPIVVNYAGKQMIVGVSASYVYGIDAQDGSFMWTYRYADLDPPSGGVGINTITPLYHDGQIYVTSGYNHVGAMLKLSEDGSDVSLLWKTTTLDCHHGGVVRVGNYIYGSNWINNNKGNWCCVDWTTGETMYEEEWVSKGSIIYADGMLYCYSERRGHFALVEPNPERFAIASSFQITQGRGRHWAHPMIRDGVMYMRRGDVLMAYHVQGE